MMLSDSALFEVALVIYVSLAAEFVVRYACDHPFDRNGQVPVRSEPMGRNTKFMLIGLGMESVFSFIRCERFLLYRQFLLTLHLSSSTYRTIVSDLHQI